MPLRRPRLLPLLLLAAAACRAPGPPAPEPSASMPGPLVPSLQVQTAPDSVRLVLQVTNASGAPVAVTFPSGQSYDFVVTDAGREVWRWSDDMGFTQAIRTETLAPGATLTYAETWRPAAALRGRPLTAVGRLTSSDRPVEVASPFVLR